MNIKNYFSFVGLLFSFTGMFAGGIVTNTNQSASWTRNPSTAAVTGIEAVYYNPAGIAKLENGLHISLSNQSIFQTREIENSYSGPSGLFGLNQPLYKGTINAPVFPTVYAAYKVNKLAFSFGFNPIGGGGSAEFKTGLPSFELGISDLAPALASQGVTAYRLETYFKGTSIYFGYQLGVTYQFNDMISVFAGARYVTVKNANEGYLRNIQVNMNGTWIPASTVIAGVAASASGAATNLQNAITAGYLQANDPLTDATAIAGLQQMGIDPTGYTNSNAVSAYQQAAVGYTIKSKLLRNQSADVEQSGSGICPILGLNISTEKLNIGIKYEFATKMNIKNKTTLDFVVDSVPGTATTQFPDGREIPNDMPGLLTVGADYKATDKLSVSGSFYYYFDKAVKYGKMDEDGNFLSNKDIIKSNFYEIGAGIEYLVTEKLLLSTGYLYGKSGVKPEFQSDLLYSISSQSFGIGGKYSISPKVDINLGVAYSMYMKGEKTGYFSDNFPDVSATETYMKSTLLIGIGANIKLSK